MRELTLYGKTLKHDLIEKGMTQTELATKIGTSKQYLGKIIYGERSGQMYLNAIDNVLNNTNTSIKQGVREKDYIQVMGCLIEIDRIIKHIKSYSPEVIFSLKDNSFILSNKNKELFKITINNLEIKE